MGGNPIVFIHACARRVCTYTGADVCGKTFCDALIIALGWQLFGRAGKDVAGHPCWSTLRHWSSLFEVLQVAVTGSSSSSGRCPVTRTALVLENNTCPFWVNEGQECKEWIVLILILGPVIGPAVVTGPCPGCMQL